MKKLTAFKFIGVSILSFGITSTFLMSSIAKADVDYGLEIGIHSQSGDAEGVSPSTTSTTSQTSTQFGGVAYFPITPKVSLRTGMLYTQRPLVVNTTGGQNKISLNYLDIPLAVMFNFEDHAGVFGGVSLGMNLDKSCDAPSCSLSDVKSPITPLIFGASFKFAPQLGATIYFESFGDSVAKSPSDNYSLKNYRAVGANLMITFN